MRRKFTAGFGGVLAIEELAALQEYDEGDDASSTQAAKIAIVCIEGPLSQRAGWFGPGYDSIRACFEAALESDATAVVLKINSPGGDAAGNIECAKAMVAAKEASGKPVWAFSDESAYSAAYAIACVADKIFLPESGGVGSIGCLCVAADVTRMVREQGINAVVIRSGSLKAEGHPLIPLTKDTLARFQTRVNDLADGFAAFVGTQRGVSPKRLLSLQGACFYGKDAVAKKLADGIMSFDAMLAKLGTLDEVAQAVPFLKASDGTQLQEGRTMTLKQLEAALVAAQAAGNAAKVKSLQAKISAKKAEEAEEDEEDEGADEESKKSAPPPPKKPDDGDDDDDDDDGDDDEESDEPEEEEEETKKTTTVKTYRRSKKAQASLGSSIGELFPGLTAAQIQGRIAALKQNDGETAKLRAEMDELKRSQRAERVGALISSARRAGKVSKAQVESLRAMGMKKNGLNELKAFLDATPARVSTIEDGGEVPSLDQAVGAHGLTVLETTIATRMGVSHESFAKQKTIMSAGIVLSRVSA